MQDCRKRWLHSLDPSVRKGRWTKEEDRILLDAYARLGPAWNEIARLIPGRKDDQCSKRHRDILAPLARNRLFDWTPEEDQILREGVRDLGHKWTSVAARLPGRPPLTCRNRWRNLCKQEATANKKSGQDAAQARAETGTQARGEARGEAGTQVGAQPAGESSAVSQSASPTAVSREGDAMEAQFNIEDFIAAEDYGVASSGTNASPAASCPEVPEASYAALSTYDTDPTVNNDLLGATPNLDGFPNVHFAEPYQRQIGSSMAGAGSPLPNVPVDPILRAGEHPLQAGTQAQQHPGTGTPCPPPDLRALELASEMAALPNSQEGDPTGELGVDMGGPGGPIPQTTADGEVLRTFQLGQHGHLHITHHHHHYHHYHHHHHYHRHYH